MSLPSFQMKCCRLSPPLMERSSSVEQEVRDDIVAEWIRETKRGDTEEDKRLQKIDLKVRVREESENEKWQYLEREREMLICDLEKLWLCWQELKFSKPDFQVDNFFYQARTQVPHFFFFFKFYKFHVRPILVRPQVW